MVKKLLIFLVVLTRLSAFNACCGGDCGYWWSIDYLYEKIREDKKIIPLVVEGPIVPSGAPILGIPGSNVVLGNEKIDSKWRSGVRVDFGFGCNQYCGTDVEVDYFFLGKATRKKSVFSDGSIGSSFLAVPFFNTVSQLESSLAIAFPGSYEGKATLKLSNQMQGAELNGVYRATFFRGGLDVFGGIRYINFIERFTFETNSPYINPALNNVYFTRDRFKVDNNFYGAQIGATYKYECASWLFSLNGQIAIGPVYQTSHAHGKFVLNDFTNFTMVQEFNGGFFALPSNSGTRKRTRFCVVPEANLNLGYLFTECCSVHVGYNFLYISNMSRAASQLNRKINPTQSALYQYSPIPVLVGKALPRKHLSASKLWVQGVNVTVECVF